MLPRNHYLTNSAGVNRSGPLLSLPPPPPSTTSPPDKEFHLRQYSKRVCDLCRQGTLNCVQAEFKTIVLCWTCKLNQKFQLHRLSCPHIYFNEFLSLLYKQKLTPTASPKPVEPTGARLGVEQLKQSFLFMRLWNWNRSQNRGRTCAGFSVPIARHSSLKTYKYTSMLPYETDPPPPTPTSDHLLVALGT